MRLPRCCLPVLAVLALAGLDDVTAPSPAAGAVLCAAPAAQPAGVAKSSSLAPHPRSGKRVYGAPIQRPIFKSRTPARRHPAAPATH
jgi:hypothetical protein